MPTATSAPGPSMEDDLDVFLRKFFIFFFNELLFWTVSSRRQVGRQFLPKNLPKIFQRLPKIVPKSLSGGGFGWLGSVLEGSWGVLGRLGPS